MSKTELFEGRDYKSKANTGSEGTAEILCAQGCDRELMRCHGST